MTAPDIDWQLYQGQRYLKQGCRFGYKFEPVWLQLVPNTRNIFCLFKWEVSKYKFVLLRQITISSLEPDILSRLNLSSDYDEEIRRKTKYQISYYFLVFLLQSFFKSFFKFTDIYKRTSGFAAATRHNSRFATALRRKSEVGTSPRWPPGRKGARLRSIDL